MTDHLIVIIYAIFNLWELWGSLENWTIFWWRHNRSRWRHNILKFVGLVDFELIFSKKQSSSKFDIPAACWIKEQAPYFLNSIIEKSTNSKENPQTRPFSPLSQPCWNRWCSQIWWLIGVERYWFYFCKLPLGKHKWKIRHDWIKFRHEIWMFGYGKVLTGH